MDISYLHASWDSTNKKEEEKDPSDRSFHLWYGLSYRAWIRAEVKARCWFGVVTSSDAERRHKTETLHVHGTTVASTPTYVSYDMRIEWQSKMVIRQAFLYMFCWFHVQQGIDSPLCLNILLPLLSTHVGGILATQLDNLFTTMTVRKRAGILVTGRKLNTNN